MGLRLAFWFYGWLVLVNVPVFFYRAAVGSQATVHSRGYWILSAVVNGTIGGAGMLLIDRARRRKQRINEGQCVRYGYDLRATPDRCPECGTAPNATARSSPA